MTPMFSTFNAASVRGLGRGFISVVPLVWASSGAVSSGAYSVGSSGTKTAALLFGGYGGTYLARTEQFNGSTWSSGGNMVMNSGNGISGPVGAGTSTSTFAVAGTNGPYFTYVDTYNGTSWSSTTAANSSHTSGMAAGTSATSGLAATGYYSGFVNTSETFNGSSWTTQGNINALSRYHTSGCGTQTAAIYVGGGRDAHQVGAEHVVPVHLDAADQLAVHDLVEVVVGLTRDRGKEGKAQLGQVRDLVDRGPAGLRLDVSDLHASGLRRG